MKHYLHNNPHHLKISLVIVFLLVAIALVVYNEETQGNFISGRAVIDVNQASQIEPEEAPACLPVSGKYSLQPTETAGQYLLVLED
ncbi:hypothetical protein J4417_05540 [Candidatus Woesearchaeota archaeon]|nr:hypothetical protein [Candidatus Woesearchaeota archaeon]